MEEFKVSLFEEENSNSFPSYFTLSVKECGILKKKICDKYKIEYVNFEHDLLSKQSIVGNSNAESNMFSLKKILAEKDINPLLSIFINWYRFEKVDRFSLDDIDRYFNDIWFPVSDDIDLFDESLNWILSITHYGAIYYIKS